MMLTDTHTHIYMPDEFAADGGPDAAVRRAVDAGVERMILPCVDLSSLEPMESLAARYPDNIRMAIGLHPTEVPADWREITDSMLRRLDEVPRRYIAIGEIGMDLYWDKTMEREQMDAFEYQARAAVRRGLPIIIHCREALGQTLEVLQSVPGVRAVFHSFSGTSADVERIRRTTDPWFGINGIVTFKSSTLHTALPAIGTDRLLLETDSPYLAPVPRRGRRNESAFLVYTAAFVADKMGLSVDELADITNNNTDKCFNF